MVMLPAAAPTKNRQWAGGLKGLVLLVSAPPDRLRRGIKATKEEQAGQVHAPESNKSPGVPPPLRAGDGDSPDMRPLYNPSTLGGREEEA